MRRRLALLLLIILVGGCSTKSYFVADMSTWSADEEWDVLISMMKTREPGVLTIHPARDWSTSEKEYTFDSDKTLVSGKWLRSSESKERWQATVRNGSIIAAHRSVQMIEVHTYWCGNISGHGDFCGITTYFQCEKWGTHALRNYCQNAQISKANNPRPNASAELRIAPMTPPVIVHKEVKHSAGDALAGAEQPNPLGDKNTP